MRTLKFFQFLAVAIVSVMTISSCDKDNDNPLVGTWTSTYSDEYGTENYLFTFNADKTFVGELTYTDSETSDVETEHVSGTYVLDEAASKLHMTDSEEGDTITYNISISKNTVTLTDPEESEFTIVFHKK